MSDGNLLSLWDDFDADLSAVSPVISVILMVAITVILASVISVFVLGLTGSGGGSDVPSATFEVTPESDGTFTVVHIAGDPLPAEQTYIVYDDRRIPLAELTTADEVTAGDRVQTPTPPASNTLEIVYEAESDSAILSTLTLFGTEGVFADDFTASGLSEYVRTNHENWGNTNYDYGFEVNADSSQLETDDSNNEITLQWAENISTVEGVDAEDIRVATEARTPDNDGVGVFIRAADGTYYEAVVTNDFPRQGSGIYTRSGDGASTENNQVAATGGNFNPSNAHEIELAYNGSALLMYVDGALEAEYAVNFTPKGVGLTSLANDPTAFYQYIYVTSQSE